MSIPLLSLLIKVLVRVRRGVFRVLTLAVFGGKWSYIGVTLFFLLPHFSAASAPPGTEQWVLQVLGSAGNSLASSWQELLMATGAAETATGFKYWDLLDTAVFALVDLLWFYRTVGLVIIGVQGRDYSPLLLLIFASVIFNLLAFSVTGEIPFFELAELVQSLPGVLDYGRGFDFFSGNGSVNASGVLNETLKNSSM